PGVYAAKRPFTATVTRTLRSGSCLIYQQTIRFEHPYADIFHRRPCRWRHKRKPPAREPAASKRSGRAAKARNEFRLQRRFPTGKTLSVNADARTVTQT